MARITYTGVISEIKGSLSGTTFQKNASGNICRKKPLKFRSNSLKQTNRIHEFVNTMAGWSALNGSYKAQWAAFAANYSKYNKWGESKQLTGYNWFQSINNNLILIGEEPISVPPTWDTPLAVPVFTGSFIPTDTCLNFSPEFEHADHALLLYTSQPVAAISETNRKQLRLTKVIYPGDTTEIDYENDWSLTHSIPIPIPGAPQKMSIIAAVCTISVVTGISSVFRQLLIEIENS